MCRLALFRERGGEFEEILHQGEKPKKRGGARRVCSREEGKKEEERGCLTITPARKRKGGVSPLISVWEKRKGRGRATSASPQKREKTNEKGREGGIVVLVVARRKRRTGAYPRSRGEGEGAIRKERSRSSSPQKPRRNTQDPLSFARGRPSLAKEKPGGGEGGPNPAAEKHFLRKKSGDREKEAYFILGREYPFLSRG